MRGSGNVVGLQVPEMVRSFPSRDDLTWPSNGATHYYPAGISTRSVAALRKMRVELLGVML